MHDRDELAGKLRARLTGSVLVPDDAGFAEVTAGFFNSLVPHRPAVVVAPASQEEVRITVQLAAEAGVPIALSNTGHSQPISIDGAVLIDLRRLDDVQIDPGTATARVGPGTRWGQVVEAAAKFGLAPLCGSSPGVGVIGYTLGGGHSPFFGRLHGWAADQVESMRLVTSDGAARDVTADTDPDLFWALLGAKGNLGVVTSLTFRLIPVTRLYGGGLFFDGSAAPVVLPAWRELTDSAPRELSTSLALMTMPDLPMVPEPLRGRLVLHVRLSHLGSAEEGADLIAPLRAAAPLLLDSVVEMPTTALATIHNDPPASPPALERTALLTDLPDEAIEAVLKAAGPAAEDPVMLLELRHLGGALDEPTQITSAATAQTARYNLLLVALLLPDLSEAVLSPGLDNALARFEPFSEGTTMLNAMGTADASPRGARAAYDDTTYQRLAAVKAQYDPDNLFRFNHNIAPAGN
uniref:FAD-binding oxidoreductase n=1 Tax=Paractinoplanes polyasparticus TaxID=2856853 RepID=UPI001C84A7F9|nr:FAD-binding oxidoreductase [Actinoplanes polyasparticus]